MGRHRQSQQHLIGRPGCSLLSRFDSLVNSCPRTASMAHAPLPLVRHGWLNLRRASLYTRRSYFGAAHIVRRFYHTSKIVRHQATTKQSEAQLALAQTDEHSNQTES